MKKQKKLFMLFTILTIIFFATFKKTNCELYITYPQNDSTVSGPDVLFTGTSTNYNTKINLILNSVLVGSTTTNPSGNWSFNYPSELPDGACSASANALSENYEVLDNTLNNFSVSNPPKIIITNPQEGQFIDPTFFKASGSTSALSDIAIYLDSAFTQTVYSDSYGNWEANYPNLLNGTYSLKADLILGGSTLASSTVGFISKSEIYFPENISQMRIVSGAINTQTPSSGTGPGYSYIKNTSDVVITFDKAFSTKPIILCSGQHPSGTSNITISSANGTNMTLEFSAGTEYLNFEAKEFVLKN